jgi:hypothetical protein
LITRNRVISENIIPVRIAKNRPIKKIPIKISKPRGYPPGGELKRICRIRSPISGKNEDRI